MTGDSKKIASKVFRNLESNGIKIDDILDEEVYDELTAAQDNIISTVFPDTIISITIKDGIDTYELSTDTINPERRNIASVKVVEVPQSWRTPILDDFGNIPVFPSGFNVIPNKEFIDFVNLTRSLTGQPSIATIIGGQLKVYPVPTIDYDGDVLKLYTYLSSSSGIIDDVNEPELPEMFNKALEKYAVSQFLAGDQRQLFFTEFTIEIQRLRSIINRKHHNLAQPVIPGW